MEIVNPYLHFLLSKAHNKKIPLSGTLEITSRCNFGCKMCYIHDNNANLSDELPFDFWKKFIDEAKDSGMLNILITGGEPMIREDFSDIYSYCRKNGFMVSVNTNGSLINDKIIGLFSSLPPTVVNISLYGFGDETYKKLGSSDKDGIFERVKENILKLKAIGVQVGIHFTATSITMPDAEKVFAFAKENSLHIQYADYIFPKRNKKESDHFQSSDDAVKYQIACETLKRGADYMDKKRKLIVSGDMTADNDNNCGAGSSGILCNAGSCSCWTTYDGFLLPCGMMSNIKADLKKDSFEKCWEYVRNETEKLRQPDKCLSCKYRHQCEVCAAICFAENGAYNEVPEYVCNKTYKYINDLCCGG